LFDAALDGGGQLRKGVQKGKSPVRLSSLSTYKSLREDGSIDPSSLHWRAYHSEERSMWTTSTKQYIVVDPMYATVPEKGALAGLKSSYE
jgi:hypothetical protein